MTISDALSLLSTFQAKHGDVDVFFDCPHCGKSFPPNVIQALAVRLGSVPPMTQLDVIGGKATVATAKTP
jgi:hypothetical protein